MIFARCYDNGAYAVRVDYDQPPPEPFRPDDEAWAQERSDAGGSCGKPACGDSEAAGA